MKLPTNFFKKTINTFILNRGIFYKIFSIYFEKIDRKHVKYWAEGKAGAPKDPAHFSQLSAELTQNLDVFLKYVEPTDKVLDLGCNVGRVMAYFNKHSIKNLHGVDIMKNALELTPELFPELIENKNCKFFNLTFSDFYKSTPNAFYDCTISVGATIELINPNGRIIQNICRTTKKYVFLVINEHSHSFPKFYIYEFYRNAFDLIFLDRLAFGPEVNGKSANTVLIFMKRI
jgi:SAM-dependent methyltransferase